MNARQLLALQFASLIAMFAIGGSLFENKISTVIFAVAFFIFVRCSIYISKHNARLLRELDREKELQDAKS